MAGVFAAFGDAVRDFREKLVEEGWFGRVVTRGPQDTPAPAPEQDVFGSHVRQVMRSPADRDEFGPDRGVDR